ncbi:MAG: hypothetical protein CMJ81_00875 [Planctomycetaceae bacterium]|nr:hypothetical protein [Planctomycetaceae bacterium]
MVVCWMAYGTMLGVAQGGEAPRNSQTELSGNNVPGSFQVGTLDGGSGVATAGPQAKNRGEAVHRRRRVILNDDAGMLFQPISKPEDFVSEIATTIDTNVDSIWLSSMIGADLYVYDCKVGERAGERIYPGHEQQQGAAEAFEKLRANMKVMLDAGTDPLREVIRFGHRHGKEVFASFRMNMIQDSWRPNFQTQWKRDHPDWCLGVREMADLEDDPRSLYWSGLDFEKSPVRDQRVAVIRDICSRYDVDGMELDFWRWPAFFKTTLEGKPAEPRQVEIMNKFMRRVRRTMNGIESGRKRPLLLAVRVFDNEEISLKLGLDARTWLREGLIDILVVGGTYTYYSIETEKWVEMAHARDVPVYVCMYRPKGIERDRARTAYHMSRGAAGMYLFNWLRDPAEENAALREIGDKQLIHRKDKHYVMSGPFKTLGFRHVLPEHLVPVRLEHGEWRTATLRIGDDLQAAAAEGALATSTFQLTLQNFSPASDRLTVQLNGHSLEGPAWNGMQVSFRVDDRVLVLHDNQITLLLKRSDPQADLPVEVTGVELKIDYQQP